MLISFSVENFRSYHDRQEISLLASSATELLDNTVALNGVAALGPVRVLKSIAIYGANASGKSNLVRALDTFRKIIADSAAESTVNDDIPVVPFHLNKAARLAPTIFSATFILETVLYEYSIAVTKNTVRSEQLVAFPNKLPQQLFRRSRNAKGETDWHFSRTHFRRDKQLEQRTRENSLYLSVGVQFNHALLTKIDAVFRNLDIREPRYAGVEQKLSSQRCLKSRAFREWASQMLHTADTGIDALSAKATKIAELIPAELRQRLPEPVLRSLGKEAIILSARRLPSTGETVRWNFGRESDGTKQLFSLLRSYHGTIREGGTVVVDELDDSLHSLLSRRLVQMVHDPMLNPKGGQLIFTTHDTTLLDPTLLRRDQVYFAERTNSGSTKLYSLLEYAPRKDEALQKGYLAGRYGAVPFLGNFTFEPQDTI